MFNFDLYNPTHIIFGKDRMDMIDKNVPAEATVLITYGGGSAKRNGLIDKAKKILGHRKIYEFGGIESNPKYETLVKAVNIVRSEKISFILAVGGGSVIDGTKFIALASYYDGDARDLLMYGSKPIPQDAVPQAVPFGVVLTLPASGSEMNCLAVISYEHGKFPLRCVLAYPRFSILDPEITFTLPKIQVANGVIDAFVHVTEQYLTYPVDARVQDRFAEGVLQTLIEVGETTVAEPENYDARANLVWCATVAMCGVVGTGVPQDWATHKIGHELTALFGIDHGTDFGCDIAVDAGHQAQAKKHEAFTVCAACMANRKWQRG